MKKHLFSGISIRMSLLLIVSAITAGCSDYYLETHKPSWLGESIYKQLEAGYTNSEGTKYSFSTFIRLIDDLGYSEVLKLTGSKTLFVADDAAFNRFYLANSWGVNSYGDLSLSQKKLLLNSAMINNAYLIELMSSVEGPVDGQALRRSTALSVIDTVTFQQPNELPANNKSWDAYRESGIFLVKDNTPTPMVHFLQRQMDFKGMTDEDFSIIFNGKTRSVDDAHIFGLKVLERDITCKNGYIDILEDVLVPADNMAEVIRTKPETQVFSNMLDRFCAPYYNASMTNEYRLLHPLEDTIPIFTKKYFASKSSNGANTVNEYRQNQAGYLDYDPGWNTYNMGGTDGMQADMGVIFAPSNDVIDNFFSNGGGKFLIEKYGTVDNIPNLVLVDLLKNHMKPSFLSALPHNFDQVLDDGKQPMGITNANIVKSYLADNGVVYVTNKVYAPASYVAVTAPILVNDSTKVFNFEVKNTGFDAYLLSMDSWYSFAVPWDRTDVDAQSAGIYYVDPVSYARKQPEIFRFRHNAKNNTVNCTAFKYNRATGTIGDSIRPVSATEITDRFEDILDYHIVIGDIGDGKEYYRTKGGGEIKIVKNGITQIIGGGNIENSTFWPKVTRVYDQSPETNGRGNGKTYFLNAPLLPPYRSVYKILSDTTLKSHFGEFFKLVQGSDDAGKYGIFYKDPNYAGMDFNVRSFNTFHYTVYVPTNQAVLDAIDNGLPTWDLIKQQTDPLVKDSLSKILSNFLKYHFQDNSIYIDGSTSAQIPYETAAFTTSGTKAYYRLYTKLTPSGLSLYNNKSYTGTPVNVIKDNDLYNVMARDYKFNNKDIEKATLIETSSYAVIHQIDKVLLYQNNILMNARQLVKSGLRKTR